jgi:hypothetical protein
VTRYGGVKMFRKKGMKKLMEGEFSEEEMHLMEEDVLMHHNEGIFRHSPPTEEGDEDAYWSHILFDWLGINMGINDPEEYPLHEPKFWNRVFKFLKKNIKKLTNREGDYLFFLWLGLGGFNR